MSSVKSQQYVCLYSTSWRGGDGWYTHALAEGIAKALLKQDGCLILIASNMQPADRDAKGSNLLRYSFRAAHHQSWNTAKKLVHTVLRIAEATRELLHARTKTSTFIVTFPHWLTVTFFQFLLLRACGARIIYIVHDPLPHAWSFPKGMQWLERWLLRSTYQLSDQLVTLAKSGRQVLKDELQIDEKKLQVIPHGVFDNGPKTAAKSNRTFLIFGMLRSNKCILESIRAFAVVLQSYPDAKLIVAGAPYGAEADYWRVCEQELQKISSSVTAEIGFVEESRLESLFSLTDAVLLPYMNFNSQSGVAMLAALSMRPVIGTAVGGIAELFELGMCGVPIRGTPDVGNIATAMLQFCAADVDQWAMSASAAREDLLRKLSWASIGEEFAELANNTSVGRI